MFEPNGHDFSGDRQSVEQYRQTQSASAQSIDSTVDQWTEHFAEHARGYTGRFPATSEGLAQVVASVAQAALTLEAISGLILGFVNEELRTIRIQTVSAIISLVKTPNPHLTIDIIEHIFGLSKNKESDVARKHGVSRQVINKRTKKIEREFGIESESSQQNSEIYRQDRLERYDLVRQKLQSINARSTASTSPEYVDNEPLAAVA